MLMESVVNREEVAEMCEVVPSDELARALLPLRVISADLHEKAVSYVLSGESADVVEQVWQEPETDALFGGVGELNRTLPVRDDLADRLSAVGVAWSSDMREPLEIVAVFCIHYVTVCIVVMRSVLNSGGDMVSSFVRSGLPILRENRTGAGRLSPLSGYFS